MKAVIAILIPIIVTLLLRLVVGLLNGILWIVSEILHEHIYIPIRDVFDFDYFGEYWFFWLIAILLSLVAEVLFWSWAKDENVF